MSIFQKWPPRFEKTFYLHFFSIRPTHLSARLRDLYALVLSVFVYYNCDHYGVIYYFGEMEYDSLYFGEMEYDSL